MSLDERGYYERFVDRPNWGAVVGFVGLACYFLAALLFVGGMVYKAIGTWGQQ